VNFGRGVAGLAGLSVNTDATLVDPDWDDFAAEHDRRFGLAISQLKSQVRGRSYDNEAMILRVGPAGFYVQSRRFPAAFYGDTVKPEVRRVGPDEVDLLVWEAVATYRAGDARSLTCVYSDDDPPDVFFGYRTGPRHRFEVGVVRPLRPLHLRIVVEGQGVMEALGAQSGVLVVQRLEEQAFVVVRATGRRQPFLAFPEPGG
jgi:hypothetical protein